MIPIINSFIFPQKALGKKHSLREFSIIMFLNALMREIPNMGTQLNERCLNTLLKDWH